MRIFKWLIISIISVSVLLAILLYWGLHASLPQLDGELSSPELIQNTELARDDLGTAIVSAQNEYDAAFTLGYAHAQDRLFQMDLLRRQAAGELSELVGRIALPRDKKHRTHQFRKRAKAIFKSLSPHEQKLLSTYTAGVNAGAEGYSTKPLEYYLLSSSFIPWTPEDSLLASFSMYLDLQAAQIETDYRLSILNEIFGEEMLRFFTLPSTYQAAIDQSTIPLEPIKVPVLPPSLTNKDTFDTANVKTLIEEIPDIGSNNWAVANELTQNSGAMLSNDMHLGLSVPSIWYRAQLNYVENGESISITGVSLPGTPAVIVGSSKHIAWGFTNSGIDNVDWIELSDESVITELTEIIKLKDGVEEYTFETSPYGPVRRFKDKTYALAWVAHQSYAVNMKLADLGKAKNIDEALNIARSVRIPAQNLVLADSQGDVAWQLLGAISGRKAVARHAIPEESYSPSWKTAEPNPANMIRPDSGRVWSANARMVSAKDIGRYGNGGYALGARQKQIVSSLMENSNFTERDFYDIHLDNRAVFLGPWHNLLLQALEAAPTEYADDIKLLNEWDACACEDSIGYTLVRRFRSEVINMLLAPINKELNKHDLSVRYMLRGIEPAIWALIDQNEDSWLPVEYENYQQFFQESFKQTKSRLVNQYALEGNDYTALAWGNVNALEVRHPFSGSVGPFGDMLNMPKVKGFGDSYMPAVQSKSFGASQRLIVRPNALENGILTIPGGQSGHFLSKYFEAGFLEYAGHQNTPLLPGDIKHRLRFSATAD
ncbi:penicillin acylase family protein [Glaciecola petra]|uniref:Penicillin acylase family protein n=1 Tax=Glaciecola petra TaxID=3075602 RepID=A0ABU2ZNG1_9ALTE|nr:penicillin acylase family protein [Aestuariibacter sp. P117]MDT0594165.1 penicillin acylase family protein [Aestuariibacter sp. P117]